MLLSFRVTNHRSFRGEHEFLLLPVYDKTAPAIVVAGIYGANASGKSNLLDAMRTMRTAVLDSFARWEPLGGVPRDPFALNNTAREGESAFGVDLLLEGEKYVYGFAVDDERVREEWLYHYPRGRRRVLFERATDDFTFGDSLRGPKNLIEEVTRPNSLFLSAAAHHGMDQLLPVYSWFARQLIFAEPDHHARRRGRTMELLRDPVTADRIVKLLKAADLGISDVRMSDSESSDDGDQTDLRALPHAPPTAEPGVRENQALSRQLSETRSGEMDLDRRPHDPSRIAGLFGGVIRRGRSEVSLIRETAAGPVSLRLEQESNGTRTWFDFLGLITDVLDHGWVLAVDELDASLHPLLAREFVRLFQRRETNSRGAQLIFTTHDTSLLARHQGEETLRRDEIWFTEKNQAGETQLYPLTDFKPRSGLNWERRYLGGSVGAVPFLDDDEFVAAVYQAEGGDE